jgi:AcrR family transcriptional regulator
MANKPKASKRDAILDSMLDLVVERGFHDAPMSLVAKRSGASAGVIYHYFNSKEEIFQALYERTRALKIEAFVGNFSPDQSPRDTFIKGCLNVYGFHRKHKREMRFYEQYEHAGFARASESLPDDERVNAFARRFSSHSSGGVLKEWPTDVLQELTTGLIGRLASQRRKLSQALLTEIAESLWETVRFKEQ